MIKLPGVYRSCLRTAVLFKVVLLGIWLSLCLMSQMSEAASDTLSKKKVLVLNSYHKGLSWTDSIVKGIESVLKPGNSQVELHFEYMDTKRYYGEQYTLELYAMYKHKFSKERFDVVIVSDNNALNFMLEYHDELFPLTPVVFCGINDYKDEMLAGRPLFTGVVEKIDIKSTLEAALKLHPYVTKVVSVNDKTTTGKAVKNEVLKIVPLFEDRVDFVFFDDYDLAELKNKVWKLPRDSIILLSVISRDKSGHFFAYEESLAHIYGEASVPIYSFWDTYIGKGIVGGMLTSGFHQGRSAAQVARRILDGESIEKIPVERISPNKYFFDYRQLKLFDISESDLPEGSIVINQPDTLYSKYKSLFLGIFFTITSLLMIIFVLLTLMHYRKKMETVLRDSEEKYRDLYENAPDMYHTINKDAVIIYCNETEARMLGYRKGEIIGKPVSDFFTQHTKEAYCRAFFSLKDSSVHHDVKRELVRKDGSTFTASISIFPEVDAKGELIEIKEVARDITEQKRVEELKKSQQQLRSLSAYLESAREEEKKRIAREIHDELGHILTTLSLDLSWLRTRLSKDKEAMDVSSLMERTGAMSELIESTVQTVQRISSELTPGILDHLGLSEAIKWQIDKYRKRTGIMYDVSITPENIMLDNKRSIVVFRIFQETLTNIVRHSEATEVLVDLKEEDGRLILDVTDNGKGIQEDQVSDPESVGIIGIMERARILGGSVSIYGENGKGTNLKLMIPIDEGEQV